MPRKKQTGLCIICFEDPCECPDQQPKGKSKKKVQPSTTVTTVEPTVQTTTASPAPSIDLKAAMKAAMKAETHTPADKTTTPDVETVPHSTRRLDAPSDEELDARAVLAPILHPDEITPYAAEIWKRRRAHVASDTNTAD